MEKKEQLLIIDPKVELTFHGPFNQAITSHMRLTNPTEKTIVFKIKTTAPKKYCVRPNCGTLTPSDTIEIAICLQPFVYDPNEKNKHKFMVQSLVAPDGETQFDQLWKDITPDQLMDSKLRCVFELPVEGKSTKSTVHASEPSEFESLETSQQVGDEKNGEVHQDIASVMYEMRQLREEESKLRQENIQLNEHVLRLQLSLDKVNDKSNKLQHQNKSYSPPQLAEQQMPLIYIAAAIAMAIFGLILGKFVF